MGKSKGKGSKDPANESSINKLKPACAIQVRHILCEKQSKIMDAWHQIKVEQKPFQVVAEQYSEDKARQGGSLGWQSKGSMVKVFDRIRRGGF